MKYINIDFPFKDSNDGTYLKMNVTDEEAIKADLMHLLFTGKNQRYYYPDFGTNLYRYIFDMNDDITSSAIKDEINMSIKKFIPKLNIDSINVTVEDNSNIVEIKYTVTEDAFQLEDSIKVAI